MCDLLVVRPFCGAFLGPSGPVLVGPFWALVWALPLSWFLLGPFRFGRTVERLGEVGREKSDREGLLPSGMAMLRRATTQDVIAST
jgi:hypothetical protein